MSRRLLPLLILLCACRPPAGEPAPASPGDKDTPVARERVQVDSARMLRDIESLASDEMAGRFTLGEGLEPAARFVASRHRELGLVPMGGDYEVPFEVEVGARVEGPQRLILRRHGAASEVSQASFVPTRISASGTARGPLVFVGYAARAPAQAAAAPAGRDEDVDLDTSAASTPSASGDRGPRRPGDRSDSPDRPGEIAHAYDDLAGISVTGKVALVLAHAPNLPDVQALFRVLEEITDAFEVDARPHLAAGDEQAMVALHRTTRERVASVLEPFLQGHPLPPGFWEVADPLQGKIDLLRLLAPILAEYRGPRFDPREHSVASKVARLEAAGAVGVIVVEGPRSKLGAQARERDELPPLADATPGVLPPRAGIPVVALSWREADRRLRIGGKRLSALQKQIDTELRPRSRDVSGLEVELTTRLVYESRAIPNVVAQLPGTDLADELVVIGAHYDHIGTGALGQDCRPRERKGVVDEICNGADDNASGTAMLLELARALAAAGERPRRTLVFAHFAGEELGLLGSQALADDPPFARDGVVAMINLDMVGRLGGRGLFVGGVTTSAAWMPLLEQVGTHEMAITYDGLVTRRSDQASFYRHRIPVLFFFTGMHPDYHRVGDHVARINTAGLQSIASLVGELVWALAQGHAIPYAPPTVGDGLTDELPGQGEVVKAVEAGRTSIK